MKEFYVKELPKNCKGCPCACFDHYEITCNLNEGLNLYDIVETIITKTGRKKKIYNYMTRPKECPLKTFKEYDKEIVKKICEELKELRYKVSKVNQEKTTFAIKYLEKIREEIKKRYDEITPELYPILHIQGCSHFNHIVQNLIENKIKELKE